MLSEDLGQVCLAREAALEYILMRCHACRGAEHLKKMIAAVTGLFGEGGEANV
jgi:hypothetical protein